MIAAAYSVLHLSALPHNLTQIRRYAPDAKIMAVIKANAYGHGMKRLAFRLQSSVDAFAVARVSEGVELRKAGCQLRIVVLEGFSCADELHDLLHYQLDALVHSHAQLAIFEAEKNAHHQIAIWLKIDTGMNRLGFKPHEVASVHERLTLCPLIKSPINLMTHLANSDDKNDDFTAQQIALFQDTTQNLSGERSIANSAGIIAWRDALSDWVRPGLMLYGMSPFADSTGEQLGLRTVMSLHSRLIAVKALKKGERVGYAGTWFCEKDTTLGVVAIGYGDGYPRHAKTGTPVLVNGQRVPLVGRVSMDMITVDLASQPDAQVGDAVTLWGEGLAIEEIAQWSDTIPYTLVCGVTQRVRMIEK